MALIDLRDAASWPPRMHALLHGERDVLIDWFLGRPWKSAPAFDAVVRRLEQELARHETVGYHCTRLTDAEIELVLADGMKLPDAQMLTERIGRCVGEGLLAEGVAQLLLARHQANDAGRKGRLWFCAYPPHEAGEGGVGRFFRHWGGEALYNSHEDDPETSPILRSIGSPCIVEAHIPIADLQLGFVPLHVMARYMATLGHTGVEQSDSDVSSIAPLAERNVAAVHRSPDAAFHRLAGFIP